MEIQQGDEAMKAYMKRVVAEKQGLDSRIDKLLFFMGKCEFDELPIDEQHRMRRQEVLMELYSEVLAERIKASK